MSNPYDSAGAAVGVSRKSQSVAASKPPAVDIIGRLNVPEIWKKRFSAIELAGGPDLPHMRRLAFRQSLRVYSNLLALLFGPVYFLCKGMWRQAVFMTVVQFAVVLVLVLAGVEEVGRPFVIAVEIMFAQRANVLYYRKLLLDELAWW